MMNRCLSAEEAQWCLGQVSLCGTIDLDEYYFIILEVATILSETVDGLELNGLQDITSAKAFHR